MTANEFFQNVKSKNARTGKRIKVCFALIAIVNCLTVAGLFLAGYGTQALPPVVANFMLSEMFLYKVMFASQGTHNGLPNYYCFTDDTKATPNSCKQVKKILASYLCDFVLNTVP